ncbi:MAG: hypothetical protein JKY84_08470 [Emcibacteraceae bacterium]|nr:hypothetical protein [Emcibacteraceae bacterium]
MFNLYNNSINQNGFMGLVSKNVTANSQDHAINSRKIVSGFAIVSLLVLSVIANGSQYQTSVEAQKLATIASYVAAL